MKNCCKLRLFDTLLVFLLTALVFLKVFLSSLIALGCVALWMSLVMILVFSAKGIYKADSVSLKGIYQIFEGAVIGGVMAWLPTLLLGDVALVFGTLITFEVMLIIAGMLLVRTFAEVYYRFFVKTKNVLIVGAGQDGKLIAEEIQARPELGLKVVGFLDDNMNNIEDEDSSIPVLGLTCDSDAVIKDNDVKIVIIAVKSRMDSVILTDLVRGIPLGVKVWRMPKFYEKITKKYLVSKMAVNWLFYDCVKRQALIYSYLKRFCDIVASLFILVLTLPLSIIAMIGIKFSDLGPVFYFQTRIGKFGKPFNMIKFRTMYQKEVEEDFDDDLTEVEIDDKRIMPFCRILRKYHIDELPQMINILRGEMSLVGPRPVREEVYYENKDKVPFWECRNWVRPGWCGWQQANNSEPSNEDRLGYDLYYVKHQSLHWEIAIFFKYIWKVICGG